MLLQIEKIKKFNHIGGKNEYNDNIEKTAWKAVFYFL